MNAKTAKKARREARENSAEGRGAQLRSDGSPANGWVGEVPNLRYWWDEIMGVKLITMASSAGFSVMSMTEAEARACAKAFAWRGEDGESIQNSSRPVFALTKLKEQLRWRDGHSVQAAIPDPSVSEWSRDWLVKAAIAFTGEFLSQVEGDNDDINPAGSAKFTSEDRELFSRAVRLVEESGVELP